MAQQIVHNQGVNYSLYYNVLNYFKTIMQNHPSIEVVTYGDLTEFDDKEFPAYPIGNILITDTSFGTNVTNFTIQLIVADKQKNKNNESNPITNKQKVPFYGVDDMVDIHANTLAILNDLTAYTQRGVAGFEINTDIVCEPFSDRFNNGLAGWAATFELTTHNDKNRCLFFLINPEGDAGFIIQDCLTGLQYKAILNTTMVPVGGVFSTLKAPNLSPTYGNLVCYTIVEPINSDDWDFVNLPILELPVANYGNCLQCELWINPKIWGTTPATWGSAPYADFRTWSTT